MRNLWKWGLAAVFAAGMAGPLFLLFGSAAAEWISKRISHPFLIAGPLFWRSVGLNTAAAVLCGILGVLASLGIWTFFRQYRRQAYAVLLLCALIPPFIHVHSWIKAADALNSLIGSISGLPLNFTGAGAVIWTTAFSYLPFTAGFCLAGLFGIPWETLDLLRMEIKPKTLFFRCIVPSFLPYALIGILFIFVVTMNDYAIPSAFGVNVFALELFSLYSANGDLYAIALSSLPLVLLSMLLVAALGAVAKRYEMTGDPVMNENPFKREIFMRRSAGAGVAVLVLFAGVPVGAMIMESFFTRDFFRILAGSGKEIGYSFLISACAAVLSVVPSALLSYTWYRSKCRPVLLFLLSLPLLIPSAIAGLGLILFWNQGILAGIYRSPFMPAIGLAMRFSILAILFLMVRIGRIEQDLMDAMHLSYSFLKGFSRILLPMIWRDLFACAILVFSLSMGEYGIVLLVTPPGYQMLTIKIYNYLHYGASEVVYTLNLLVFLLVLLAGTAVFLLYKPQKKKRELIREEM